MSKITGLAGALGMILAVIAGVVPIPGLDVALVLLVLGIVGGISMEQDAGVRVFLAVLTIPVIGAALGGVPAVGTNLNAIFGNVAMVATGAGATLVARRVYTMVMDNLKGLASGG